MDFVNFIVDDGRIMIVALFVLGEIIKRTEMFNTKLIPVYLLVVSIALTPALLGGYSVDNIVQAILVTGGAVLSYELYKDGKELFVDN